MFRTFCTFHAQRSQAPHRSRADPAHNHARAAHADAHGCRAHPHGPREAAGDGRRAFLPLSWVCSLAFLTRFCPPRPQISAKFRRKEARKAPTRGSGGPPSPNGGHRHLPGPPRPRWGPGWGGGLINTARRWGALEACSRDSAGSVVPPVAPRTALGTPPKPCRSRTQPRARCPRRCPRLPCTSARSAGGHGRWAPSISWVCSRAFLTRFCPPRPQISTKFRRKEARKAPTRGSGGPPSPNGGRRYPPGPPRPGRGPGGGGELINTARWCGALEACSRD
jgi:hypothetical protein